jgi:hypothetical protein
MMGSVTNSLTSLSMPLPEEPVGVGARWEVRQASVSGGLTMFQKVECELKALDPRSATLAIKIDQTAPPQPMNNPSLPAGATVMVDSVTGTGTGTMKVALDSLVPTSEADSRTTMVMSVNSGGSPQPISIETTVKLAVAPGN